MSDTLIEAAADWFARRRGGAMTPQEQAQFEVWLDASADHAAAYQEISRGWDMAGAVRSEPQVLKVREAARRAWPRPIVFRGALAACLSAAVLGGWSALGTAGLLPAPAFLIQGQHTFRTGVGQTASVKLRDGSVVTLDTDTVLQARDTRERRMLRLVKGQAFFKVAKDKSRPFVVAAGDKLVTATGTAFTVRVAPKAVEVTLVEGRVIVEEAARTEVRTAAQAPARNVESTEMKPGSKLVAAQDRSWTLDRVDTEKATSWLEGQLIFEDRPLSEAAAELNRYSAKKIVIRDPGIARARIVSVVRAGDIDGFVKVVTTAGFARVVSDTEDAVELAAPEEKISERAPAGVHGF